MSRKLIPGTLFCTALAGCGLIPNPAYEPGAVYKRELDGNYMVIASCAYDNLQKSWAPVQKTDFPERKTTRLSRHTDGTIMKVFQIDFIGQGQNTTRVEIPEPMTTGAIQPATLMTAAVDPCLR